MPSNTSKKLGTIITVLFLNFPTRKHLTLFSYLHLFTTRPLHHFFRGVYGHVFNPEDMSKKR